MSRILRIGKSKANKTLWIVFIAATLVAYIVDLFTVGGIGLFTEIVGAYTIVQALRTFMMVTIFKPTHIEHRSLFGTVRTAKYSHLLVMSGRPESIILVGEDTTGRAIKIRILRMDGDLNAIRAFIAEYSGGTHGLGLRNI